MSSLITLLFHSGKLWYSEKPVPVNVFSDTIPDGSSEMFNNAIKTWLSTAYEVQNPEVIPNVSYSTDKKLCQGIMELSDGDLITLPDGMGIKIVMSDGWQPTYNNPDNSGCEQPAEPIGVMITMPTSSAHGHTEGAEHCGVTINAINIAPVFDLKDDGFSGSHHIKVDRPQRTMPVSEPSESQEELKRGIR